jgi:hypothetical protein
MQRYMPTFFQMSNGPETWAGMKEDSQDGEWYSRADVDARIEKLENALAFYAKFLGTSHSLDFRILTQDGGKKARDALGIDSSLMVREPTQP